MQRNKDWYRLIYETTITPSGKLTSEFKPDLGCRTRLEFTNSQLVHLRRVCMTKIRTIRKSEIIFGGYLCPQMWQQGLNEGTALVLTWAGDIHSTGILKVCKPCQFKYIQDSSISVLLPCVDNEYTLCTTKEWTVKILTVPVSSLNKGNCSFFIFEQY